MVNLLKLNGEVFASNTSHILLFNSRWVIKPSNTIYTYFRGNNALPLVKEKHKDWEDKWKALKVALEN